MATLQDKEFFNLHTSGVGYLNRIRVIGRDKKSSGRRPDPSLWCSISALRGSSEDVSYTYFDCKVVGDDAIKIVEGLQEAVQAQRKVILSFRIGDVYPHLYERDMRDPNRQPTGKKEMAVLIKGRLLLISSASVDGEKVYTREQVGADVDSAPEVAARDLRDAVYDADEAPVREEGSQPGQRMALPPAAAPAHREFCPPQVAAGPATRSSGNRPYPQRGVREEAAA